MNVNKFAFCMDKSNQILADFQFLFLMGVAFFGLRKDAVSRYLLTLRVAILVLVCVVSILSRLFSVIRYESIIHEFDPWFNYRATRQLLNHGWSSFINWFDDTAWYPLGRNVGSTVYPGLMVTSCLIHKFINDVLRISVEIREVCVFMAPGFSALTAIVAYFLAMEIGQERGKTTHTASLLSAWFMGIVPGYISRSVAGSYDNEATSIFLMMATFYFWLRALRFGSLVYGATAAFFYFYMAASWGGYIFITNLIPLHAFVLLVIGKYSDRLYNAYCSFYLLGTLGSMLVPFINIGPLKNGDHMAALGIFGLVQLFAVGKALQGLMPSKSFKQFVIFGIAAIFGIAFSGLVLLTLSGVISPFSGRSYALWDSQYTRKHSPIIASVSEHQPATWATFFMDLQLLLFVFPAGIYFCLDEVTESSLFLVIYAITGTYFAGVMVRLMLTLAPIVCVGSSISLGRLMDVFCGKEREIVKKKARLSLESGAAGLFLLLMMLFQFARHCTWATSSAYSSPSVILASHDGKGNQVIIDDFREAYYWIRKNTPKSTRIMSWWDYGYQIAGFSDRTTIVDNNTWNNRHIAIVGKAMALGEAQSYEIMRQLGVDYVLLIFGGLSGFTGDDINKFLWMVRIAEGEFPEEIDETKFYSNGYYSIGKDATKTLQESLLYKMSYHGMDELMGPNPRDNARGVDLPKVSPDLTVVEEAFSSDRYIVRLYRVKKPDGLGRSLFRARAFDTVHSG